MAVTPLEVFQGISAAAGLVAALKSIFEDHDELNERLDEILTELQRLREQIIAAAADILEAIEGIRRQIDEDVAHDNMALADRALFSDRAVFDDEPAALGNSFQAASRLEREVDLVFTGPFAYVVNIRLALLKDFDPNFFCNDQFQNEFRRYRRRLSGWIAQMNDSITRSHTVASGEVVDIEPDPEEGQIVRRYWAAHHIHNSIVVETFRGPFGDFSDTTKRRVEQLANAARTAGIERDRQELGVVELESTLAAWAEAFGTSLRMALVTQVLNRPVRAIDSNRDGLMVDGRILPDNLDMRTTLVHLLTSREFLRRVNSSWDAFAERGDDRLVQLAHRRLFDREATDEEVALLRGIATTFGYAAFMTTLLYSNEYEQRHGRGIPAGGRPVAEELELPG